MAEINNRKFTRFERSSMVLYLEGGYDINEINEWLSEYQTLNGLSQKKMQDKYCSDLKSKIKILTKLGQEESLMYLRSGGNIEWSAISEAKRLGVMARYFIIN